jgi:hypothetical protein
VHTPHATGWYVAWIPVPGGVARRGEVLFCCRAEGVVRVNRPIGDPNAFLSVDDERLHGAIWEGPFTLENLAQAALARGGLAAVVEREPAPRAATAGVCEPGSVPTPAEHGFSLQRLSLVGPPP